MKTWLAENGVSRVFLLVTGVCWLLGIGVLSQHTEVSRLLEGRGSMPVLYRLREFAGLAPKVSDKIKIIGVDDKTLNMMDSWVLSVADWRNLLVGLDQQKPTAIFIDALMSKPIDPEGNFALALQDMKALETPVYIGSTFFPREQKFRKALEPQRPEFRLLASEVRHDQNFPKSLSQYLYGPHSSWEPVFSKIGHIASAPHGYLPAFLEWREGAYVPHLGLFAAQELRSGETGVQLDGKNLPLTSDGSVLVNLPPFAQSLKNAKSMSSFLRKINNQQSFSSRISSGDIVVIIPHFYTGNTDFRWSPIGYIPGGIYLVSIINSIVSGQWITPVEMEILRAALMVGAGLLLGLALTTTAFWVSLPLAVMGYATLCIVLFVWFSVSLSFFLPVIGLVGSAVTVHGRKSAIADRKTAQLRLALGGALSTESLNQTIKNQSTLNFEAREHNLTLMFVDIVGFSAEIEQLLPRTAFEHLRGTLQSIAQVVHEYNGIVDKTLGDGMLCYFGYDISTGRNSSDHATQAVHCAIEIQRRMQHQTSDPGKKLDLPLRIGINTSPTYLGNLGDENRLEFTVVGNGVNFAKRLEAACTPQQVMISATTKDLLSGSDPLLDSLKKTLIKIKHHDEDIEAFALDWDRRQSEQSTSAPNHTHRERTWQLADRSRILVAGHSAIDSVSAFAKGGLHLVCHADLERQMELSLAIDDPSGQLAKKLNQMGLNPLSYRVNWSYQESDSFVVGVSWLGINQEKERHLIDLLKSFAFHLRQSDNTSSAKTSIPRKTNAG